MSVSAPCGDSPPPPATRRRRGRHRAWLPDGRRATMPLEALGSPPDRGMQDSNVIRCSDAPNHTISPVCLTHRGSPLLPAHGSIKPGSRSHSRQQVCPLTRAVPAGSHPHPPWSCCCPPPSQWRMPPGGSWASRQAGGSAAWGTPPDRGMQYPNLIRCSAAPNHAISRPSHT